jgi:tRNA-2-methylthio-N6-dimethylallyladenosine synthase
MELLAQVEYDSLFGFKYSSRPNTPASTMADSVSESEKAARLQVLLDRQHEIQSDQLFQAVRDRFLK